MNVENDQIIKDLCRKVDEAAKKDNYRPEDISKYDVMPFIDLVEAIPDPELITTLKGFPERLMRFIGLYSPTTCGRLSNLMRTARR